MLYYVNKNSQTPLEDGEHEVHEEGCSFLPDIENRLKLGTFYSCRDAIAEAKKHYEKVDGCYYCCYSCHKI